LLLDCSWLLLLGCWRLLAAVLPAALAAGQLMAPGCWRLLAAASCLWLLILLLAAVRLQLGAGCCWLLAAAAGCWLLVAAAGQELGAELTAASSPQAPPLSRAAHRPYFKPSSLICKLLAVASQW